MRYTIPDRESHVARWRSSGLSRHAYCRQAGLIYPTFCGWARSCGDATPPPESEPGGFIEVARPVPAMSVAPAVTVAIQLACGTSLLIPQGTDAAWVGCLAAAVRRC